jgi:hypothetical protein
VTDPELLQLTDDIAVAHSQITELLSSLDERAPKDFTAAIRAHNNALLSALEASDTALADAERREILRLQAEAEADEAKQRQVRGLQRHKAKLIESQRKREMELGQYIPISQALALSAAIVNIVQTHVADPRTQAKIADAIRLLDRQYGA